VPETEFVAKTDAIEDIRRATGYGRYIIDRKMDELAEAGKIAIFEDPGDKRKKIISRAHIQVIIAAFKVNVQES